LSALRGYEKLNNRRPTPMDADVAYRHGTTRSRRRCQLDGVSKPCLSYNPTPSGIEMENRKRFQFAVATSLMLAALTGCVSEAPRYGQVLTMKPGEGAEGDYPAPGTVWRLDEAELKRLSPAPYQEAPPPPRRPPPPPAYYPPPPPPWYY
jgi:hypothetical protein